MKSRKCLDSLNFSSVISKPENFWHYCRREIYLANLYISVTKNSFEYEQKRNDPFLKVREILSAYRYRSVLNIFHEVYLFFIEYSAMTQPNQRAVAKLRLKKKH